MTSFVVAFDFNEVGEILTAMACAFEEIKLIIYHGKEEKSRFFSTQ